MKKNITIAILSIALLISVAFNVYPLLSNISIGSGQDILESPSDAISNVKDIDGYWNASDTSKYSTLIINGNKIQYVEKHSSKKCSDYDYNKGNRVCTVTDTERYTILAYGTIKYDKEFKYHYIVWDDKNIEKSSTNNKDFDVEYPLMLKSNNIKINKYDRDDLSIMYTSGDNTTWLTLQYHRTQEQDVKENYHDYTNNYYY